MFDLQAVPQNVKYYPEYDHENGKIRAVTYDGMPILTDDGMKKTKVFAYIGFPEKFRPTQNGKMPGIVLVHGGGGHAYAKWVKMWCERGYAAIAMDTTGFFPAEISAGTSEGSLAGKWIHELNAPFAEDGYVVAPTNSGMKNGVEDEITQNWMYHALSDVMLARRLLALDNRVDEKNIGITGISWGGVITSLVIGHDSEFSFAIPVYGSGYLGDLGMGFCAADFKHETVRRRWLAEDRFDRVKMPVMWLFFNDDMAFSIQSNSKSYLDTKDNNPLTVLCAKDKMGHSHVCGWNPPQIMTYADAVTYGSVALPKIGELSVGENITCNFAFDGKCSATLYYTDEKITYADKEISPGRILPCMVQKWQTVPCEIEGGLISVKKPEDAVGMYVELMCEVNGEEYVISSPYIEI